MVNASLPTVRINEVLARNVAEVNHFGTYPDLIELYNEGSTSVDLSGLRLSDNPSSPNKYTFANGTVLGAGQYLVLLANNPDGTAGTHLGFSLDQEGEGVYLFDRGTNNTLLDGVTFGVQLADYSLGRVGTAGAWKLARPTFGAPNQLQATASPFSVRINEWLAAGAPPNVEDFVELYNTANVPVDLGESYLTDNLIGTPTQHRLPALTFIAAQGFLTFTADGSSAPRHLPFSLSSDQEQVALLDATLAPIDVIFYGPQSPGVSQGRCSDGANVISTLSTPTPGLGNACPPAAPVPVTVVAYTDTWRYDASGASPAPTWLNPGFDDSTWATGAGLLGRTTRPGSIPETINTDLPVGSSRLAYYFRRTFTIPSGTTLLQLSHIVDDGAVFYINGQEVGRHNMPAGTPTSSTYASPGVTDATIVGPINISPSVLVAGTNTLAVEVHQANSTFSDIMFGLTLQATLGSTAQGDLVINELLAENQSTPEPDGSTPDWAELYNSSTGNLDLGDLSLTDDLTNPRRWVFAPGTVLPGRSHLRIWFDPSRPASSTNTGYGLKAAGDSLYLFNSPANGARLMDAISFGVQAADFSIGRVPSGSTNWVLNLPSPGTTNSAAPLAAATVLRINEWMANPASGDDWFELFNPASNPVALADLWLSDSLGTPANRMKQRIPRLSFIGVGSAAYALFQADGNPQNGPDHVNFSLAASGESIGVSLANGTLIDGISFGAQAEGVSEGRFPDGASDIRRFPQTASAGAMNWLPIPVLVINEVLTHTDPPLEDAIELFNPGSTPVAIGGWYLSNTKANYRKYQIPAGVTIPPGAYRVFFETQFNNVATAAVPFTLNSAHGDKVLLSAATNGGLSGYRAQVSFDAAENGVSFGRYATSQGDVEFVPMARRTFGVDEPTSLAQFRTSTGLSNAYPKVGPIVLGEIMYQPPMLGGLDNTRDEFIKLVNLTGTNAPLYDPAYPTNRWRLRGAVSFDFPAGVTLPPGGSLLVVGFDPANNPTALAAFRSAYSLGNGVTIVGPWSGKLGNTSETITLSKPDAVQLPPHPDAGFVPYVLVEKVAYRSATPWPQDAAGTGNSIQRLSLSGYGNDPTNWIAAAAAPGGGPNGDRDGDGMPDAWELLYNLNPDDPSDASQDVDGDGMTNLQEYLAGTNPRDPSSLLRLAFTPGSSGTLLKFDAASGIGYTVQFRTSLSTGSWVNVATIPPSGSNCTVSVTNNTSGSGFYRLRTP